MAPNIKVKPLYQPIVAEYTALNITLPVSTDVTPNKDDSANTDPVEKEIKWQRVIVSANTVSM